MNNKIIWSNINLNVDDWRDGYAEFCEYNNITPGGENDLTDWMIETNLNYLDDETYNLNKLLDGKILVIADIGTWNGRKQGYKILKNNLNSILKPAFQYFEIYGNGKNIKAVEHHHDGPNYYLYRMLRPGRDPEKLLNAIYNGEKISAARLNYYTKSIYNDVKNIYGW